MTSWKTTLSGAVTSAAGFVVFASTQGLAMPKWLVLLAGFTLCGGLAAMGIAGKDASVHSTPEEVRAAGVEKASQV